MKFENIHFDKGIIEITQAKTKEPIVLPLLPEIRAALTYYIDKERPICDSDFVFLKILTPYAKPMHPGSMYNIVSSAFKKAGIDQRGRNRGSHALRSSLATALLDEDNTYPVITKVLGHTSPNTAQSYVKVECERLRSCALPVPPPSGELTRLPPLFLSGRANRLIFRVRLFRRRG